MRILALDTTTRSGSVALVEDGRTRVERAGDPLRTQAERLPADILALLDSCGLGTIDIDLFAVASGPGSFTGLRIGIATIQGLALVHHRPVVAVSALEALAQLDSLDQAPGTLIGAWIDAQRGEVFAALYRVTEAPVFHSDRLVEIESPFVATPTSILGRWSERTVRLLGDGALRYATEIRDGRDGARWTIPTDIPLLAGAMGLMAQDRAGRTDAHGPAAIRPLYVRRPDAEIDRERRAKALSITQP